jgi:hypothetical protein
MTKKTLWALLLTCAVVPPLAAQESKPAEEPAVAPDAERATPTRKIRVLQNPYDIAKFYRSSQGSPFELTGPALGNPFENPYAIAGYYRSSQTARPGGYGYSQFWSLGYSRRGRPSPVFGHRMGRNGDLFLFAPTVLAPVGPLNGVFFDDGR